MTHKALLFDLDGVLTDTARYHFLAWKQLADELGIDFTLEDNERLKGVSRMRSFEIILEIGGMSMTEEQKLSCCEKKNNIYREYIKKITPADMLPGARRFLDESRAAGYLAALGSASRNSPVILQGLGITECFDAVIDGNRVSKAKPDPEVYLAGAAALGVCPEDCIVFEDAAAGVLAAHAAGMAAVGIGSKEKLPQAEICMPGFDGVTIAQVESALEAAAKGEKTIWA